MVSLLVQQLSCYSLMKFVMTLSVILLSMLMILLSNLSVIKHLMYNMLWTGAGSGLSISMLEKLILHCLTSLITLVLLMWKWMGLFLRGNDLFSSWWLPFSSKLELSSYIVSSAKTVSKKIEAMVRSMNFFLLRLFCISINLPYGLTWNTVVTSGMVLLLDATWNS